MLEPHESLGVAALRLQDRTGIGDAIVIESAHTLRLICDWSVVLRRGRCWSSKGGSASIAAPPSSDPALVASLKTAHIALKKHNTSPLHLE
jgi:hypothetical protein